MSILKKGLQIWKVLGGKLNINLEKIGIKIFYALLFFTLLCLLSYFSGRVYACDSTSNIYTHQSFQDLQGLFATMLESLNYAQKMDLLEKLLNGLSLDLDKEISKELLQKAQAILDEYKNVSQSLEDMQRQAKVDDMLKKLYEEKLKSLQRCSTAYWEITNKTNYFMLLGCVCMLAGIYLQIWGPAP